jgi:hypothetical protein
MGSLRTKAGEAAYRTAKERGVLKGPCVLCTKPAKQQFEFWKVVENDFPYDKIAVVHDMLVPLRHVDERGLSSEETRELDTIKGSFIHPNYEWILEATHKMKSVPAHFHIHMITAQE